MHRIQKYTDKMNVLGCICLKQTAPYHCAIV